MLSQHKVIDEKPFVFVYQLGSDAWSRVEFGFKFINVHVMDPTYVFDQHPDRMLWQVTSQVFPDQTSLFGEHNQPIAVQNS